MSIIVDKIADINNNTQILFRNNDKLVQCGDYNICTDKTLTIIPNLKYINTKGPIITNVFYHKTQPTDISQNWNNNYYTLQNSSINLILNGNTKILTINNESPWHFFKWKYLTDVTIEQISNIKLIDYNKDNVKFTRGIFNLQDSSFSYYIKKDTPVFYITFMPEFHADSRNFLGQKLGTFINLLNYHFYIGTKLYRPDGTSETKPTEAFMNKENFEIHLDFYYKYIGFQQYWDNILHLNIQNYGTKDAPDEHEKDLTNKTMLEILEQYVSDKRSIFLSNCTEWIQPIEKKAELTTTTLPSIIDKEWQKGDAIEVMTTGDIEDTTTSKIFKGVKIGDFFVVNVISKWDGHTWQTNYSWTLAPADEIMNINEKYYHKYPIYPKPIITTKNNIFLDKVNIYFNFNESNSVEEKEHIAQDYNKYIKQSLLTDPTVYIEDYALVGSRGYNPSGLAFFPMKYHNAPQTWDIRNIRQLMFYPTIWHRYDIKKRNICNAFLDSIERPFLENNSITFKTFANKTPSWFPDPLVPYSEDEHIIIPGFLDPEYIIIKITAPGHLNVIDKNELYGGVGAYIGLKFKAYRISVEGTNEESLGYNYFRISQTSVSRSFRNQNDKVPDHSDWKYIDDINSTGRWAPASFEGISLFDPNGTSIPERIKDSSIIIEEMVPIKVDKNKQIIYAPNGAFIHLLGENACLYNSYIRDIEYGINFPGLNIGWNIGSAKHYFTERWREGENTNKPKAIPVRACLPAFIGKNNSLHLLYRDQQYQQPNMFIMGGTYGSPDFNVNAYVAETFNLVNLPYEKSVEAKSTGSIFWPDKANKVEDINYNKMYQKTDGSLNQQERETIPIDFYLGCATSQIDQWEGRTGPGGFQILY